MLNILEKKNKIYFIGICGTLMASAALILKEMGYKVSGSDSDVYPPMSDYLREKRINFFTPYSSNNLKRDIDLVVIGNAVGRGNPEVEYVLNNRIPFISLPELIEKFFIFNKESIVISGTHGKTTTTAMVSWLLESVGADPSFLIGGISNNFRRSYKSGNGDFFVVEGDEYDSSFFDKKPKFMHYFPDYLILNSIEFDHADIYRDMDDMVKEYRYLVNLVPEVGFITYFGDSDICKDVVKNGFCEVESFGFKKSNDWYADNIGLKGGKITYDLFYRRKFIGKVVMNMFGRHNILNSLSAIALLNRLGYPSDAIIGGLERFLGVKRRMELIARGKNFSIYEDFAHHPTAVRETLRGLRESFPKKKIIAIFEPRSWSCRLNIHQGKFVESFKDADVVIFYKVYRGDKIPPDKRFSPDTEISHLRKSGKECYYFKTTEEILDFLKLQKGDYVSIIMSNGGFDGLFEKIRSDFNSD